MSDAIAELTMRPELGDVDDRDMIAWSGTAVRYSTPKLAEDVMWVCNTLADAAGRVTELQKMADAACNSWRTVRRAAHELGVIKSKVGAVGRGRVAGSRRDHWRGSRGSKRVPRGCAIRGQVASGGGMRSALRGCVAPDASPGGTPQRVGILIALFTRLRGDTQFKAESIEDLLPRFGKLPAVAREQSRDVLAAEPGAFCENALADSLAHKGDANFLANVVSHSRHVDMPGQLCLAFSHIDGSTCHRGARHWQIGCRDCFGPAEFALAPVSQRLGVIARAVGSSVRWILED